MGTRALAVLLLAPSLALAQTAGVLTANPAEVGRADCSGSVTLAWTGSQVPAVTGQRWRLAVYADTDTCPSTAVSSTASNVVADQLAVVGNATATVSVGAGVLPTAANVTCVTSGSAADVFKKICVWLVTNPGATETSISVAQGPFTFQLARPPPPVLNSVTPANSALEVSFTRGADVGEDKAVPDEYRVEAYFGTTLVSSVTTGNTSGVRVGGLTNFTYYDVQVVAISSAGNESDPSNRMTEAPLPFESFWDRYQASGGQEQGGCGGGAGPLSLLALLPLALRRRRP